MSFSLWQSVVASETGVTWSPTGDGVTQQNRGTIWSQTELSLHLPLHWFHWRHINQQLRNSFCRLRNTYPCFCPFETWGPWDRLRTWCWTGSSHREVTERAEKWEKCKFCRRISLFALWGWFWLIILRAQIYISVANAALGDLFCRIWHFNTHQVISGLEWGGNWRCLGFEGG